MAIERKISIDTESEQNLSATQRKKARKRDAMIFAQLLYDIYQDNKGNDKINNGQINAKQSEDT